MDIYSPAPKYNGNYKVGQAQFNWRRGGEREPTPAVIYMLRLSRM